MQNKDQDFEVIHDTDNSRFKIVSDSHTAMLDYRQSGKTILFTHTGVPPALEGRGLGSKLVKAGLDYARANQLKVQSLCWFVDKYLDRHSEYADLLG